MLNILGNCAVHIGIYRIGIRERKSLIVIDPPEAHSASVSDIFIYTLDTKYIFKFSVGDNGCMEKNTSVIKLFALG
jgi:hypothetical protein